MRFNVLILSIGAVIGLLSIIYSGNNNQKVREIPFLDFNLLAIYPHDSLAFTQGLIYSDGYLYESIGLEGHSCLRKIELHTGRIVREVKLPDSVFAEGITLYEHELIQLSWKDSIAMIYDITTFELKETVSIPLEGWGITSDGINLIVSDGDSTLHFLDPKNYEEIRTLKILGNDTAITNINELEYNNGYIYANIWHTDLIAIISITTGRVTSWLSLKGLLSDKDLNRRGLDILDGLVKPGRRPAEACLNGIAYKPNTKIIYVTGKLWPKLFAIEVEIQ